MRRSQVWLAITVLVAGLAGSREAAAQGFGVYEQSACAMARAGTGVAAPCKDGSAVFFNPAALALDRERVVSIGGTLIGPRGDFTNDITGNVSDLKDNWYPVPSGYISLPVGDRLTAAFGVFAPYGLTTDWKNPDTFEGRFLAYKTRFEGIYFQPTVAYKFNEKFAVGAGLAISYSELELNQRLDLSSQQVPGAPAGFTWARLGVRPGTDFGNAHLEGNNVKFGAHFAIIAKPTDKVSIGARYLTRQKIDVNDGDFTGTQISTGFRLPVPIGPFPAGTPVDPLLAPQFREGALLGPQTGATKVTLPDQIVAGVAVNASDRFTVLFDYQWVNWSLFDTLTIELENGLTTSQEENYKDSNGVRFGVEYALSPDTVLRGGYLYHTAAAPDETVTPLLPEGARNELTLGVGQRLGKTFTIDLGYQYIAQEDRRGRTIPPVGGVVVNNGEYKFDANLFSASLSWRF
jgi:long-chain fatty acid transport protein